MYALIDRDDRWHAPVTDWWAATRDDVRVPVTVLPELAYLLSTRVSALAEVALLRAVAAGEFTVEPLEPEDYPRIADLAGTYADVAIGFTDASLVAMAERLGTTTLLTTDRRHFSVIRPSHIPAFRLVP